MDLMTAFVLLIALAVAGGIVQAVLTGNKQKQIGDEIGKIPEFTPSFQHLGADGNNGIAIDQERLKICLLKRTQGVLTHRIVTYREILSSELFEDGQTISKTARSSQIGGALVGGILLGGVGAVIGGLSGKKIEGQKVRRIDLRLVLDDPSDPTHDICFLSSETKRDSFLYKPVAELARTWQARMDVLIKRAEREEGSLSIPHGQNDPKSNHLSIGDELSKLANLRSSGILSEAEFEAQKLRLLG